LYILAKLWLNYPSLEFGYTSAFRGIMSDQALYRPWQFFLVFVARLHLKG
jgi:hypothetical protein